ncbi:MAG: hypothetical protein ACXWYT_08025 [Actinomycetota bacterium]
MPRGTRQIPTRLKKDWRKLAEAMRDVGWTFEDGTKHVKAFAPDGVTIMRLPGTPSDRRAIANATAAFKRWCRENAVEPGI